MLAPVPGLAANQRRLLGWGLVAVVLVLVGALAITVFRRVTGALSSIGQPAPPRVTQQFVVDRLEEVAKLVATEMTLRDVVTFEQTRLGFSKRALLVVTGRVAAG